MAKNKWPTKEAVDIFGHKIIRGNLVLFSPKGSANKKDTLRAGIFLRQNKTSYTMAVKSSWDPDDTTTTTGTNIFLIKDPVNYINLPTVRDALEIVDKLKNGRDLPKGFDVNIAWGIHGEDEEG
jgi:hypothetical protein